MGDNCAAWQAAFLQFGVRMAPEELFALEGAGMSVIAAAVAERHGLSAALAPSIMAAKDDHYTRNHRFRFFPGVEEFLSGLARRGIPLGLVTGCHRKRLKQTVPPSFLARFAAVVDGDAVARHKPDPEPYTKALSELGVSGGDAVVAENAPLGVRSAKAAGAYCLAITTTLPEGSLAAADEVVGSHPALFDRLTALTEGVAQK